MSLNESIVEDAALIWFGELHYAISQLEDAPAEWEVKNDLLLLKQLALVDTNGNGRGAYWFLVNQ